MNRRSMHMAVATSLASLALTLCGCPMDGFVDGALVGAEVEPGYYWVEATDEAGRLSAFRMPQQRGDLGAWLSLADGAWFDGTGLYNYSSEGSWTLEEAGDESLLDDLLQTWDPAPLP